MSWGSNPTAGVSAARSYWANSLWRMLNHSRKQRPSSRRPSPMDHGRIAGIQVGAGRGREIRPVVARVDELRPGPLLHRIAHGEGSGNSNAAVAHPRVEPVVAAGFGRLRRARELGLDWDRIEAMDEEVISALRSTPRIIKICRAPRQPQWLDSRFLMGDSGTSRPHCNKEGDPPGCRVRWRAVSPAKTRKDTVIQARRGPLRNGEGRLGRSF